MPSVSEIADHASTTACTNIQYWFFGMLDQGHGKVAFVLNPPVLR